MKNSNDTISNRTRDLPACSAVTHEVDDKKKVAACGREDVQLNDLTS
jgi:hypothetical protein